MKFLLTSILAVLIVSSAHAGTKYSGHVKAVHDGDTATILIYLGLDTYKLETVRFDGIDAPELPTPEGKVSAEWLKKYLEDKEVTVEVDSSREREKYGRLLATLWVADINVNQLLIKQGLAKEYHGGKR